MIHQPLNKKKTEYSDQWIVFSYLSAIRLLQGRLSATVEELA